MAEEEEEEDRNGSGSGGTGLGVRFIRHRCCGVILYEFYRDIFMALLYPKKKEFTPFPPSPCLILPTSNI